MAEEKQPSDVHEGSSTPPPPTGSKEDQKAAAALSNLDTTADDDSTSKKDVDTEALGKAMQNLDVKEGQKKGAAQEPRKTVKVSPADVTLLVDQLDLSRQKATELLKAHDGDPVKAMTAFVKAAA